MSSRSDAHEPKVFFIGFNKCGTKTVTHFFRANGYRSAHCRARLPIYDHLPRRLWLTGTKPIAKVMETNVAAGKPILSGLPRYRVYSDLTHVRAGRAIEGVRHFKLLHAEYPDSYFILNTRPVDNWVRSRERHDDGDFIDRYARALDMTHDEVRDHWRDMFVQHSRLCKEYFSGNPKFMEFDIERDGPEQLKDFCRPDFDLDADNWTHKGATAAFQS
jgi:hypothetical protein